MVASEPPAALSAAGPASRLAPGPSVDVLSQTARHARPWTSAGSGISHGLGFPPSTPASGWCFAHLIARDEPHAFNAAFRLDRFAAGTVIDEKGQGAQPNLH